MDKKYKKGKFIVFEGIDGAGVETQGKLLISYLKRKKKEVEMLDYPDYKNPIGKLIYEFLYKKYNFPVDVQFLLHLTDFIKDKNRIHQYLKEGKTIVSLRYFTSTLAYQGFKGFSLRKAVEIADLIELPRPDLIIYLKIPAKLSIIRKHKEKKHLDRNESDRILLEKVGKFYDKLIKKQVFGKWVVIDGEKSIKDVFKEVLEEVTELKIK